MNDSSSVAPPSGYQTSTDGMNSAARNITDEAEQSQDAANAVQPTVLTQQDFGVAHGAHHTAYSAGIQELGNASVAMCANLTGFAQQIGAAGSAYGANDGNNASTVSTAGR